MDRTSQQRREADNACEIFRAENESRRDCLVFHLSDRGFFAELNDVARAAIYAWQHDLQLLLDSTRFAFRIEHGWADYFEPFCRDASEVAPARVRERFEFNPQSQDRLPVRQLQRYSTEEVHIGEHPLSGFGTILDFFQRMIFRPNARCRAEMERLIGSLSLADRYGALHVRRGDKIGDEDVHHSAAAYLQALGELSDDGCLFVMSDDRAAVDDVRRALARRGMHCRIATLCTEHDRGFDVQRLRRGVAFMTPAAAETVSPEYKWRATTRLLAETVLASRATRAVSSERSFVGKALRALAASPDAVTLLTPNDARRFSAPKLPAGRHILDVHPRVFLIRIGHRGAGFFAYVQYALNQIRYCERHGYLPVVHYDRDYANHFFDPSTGEDVWDYYFEPVAGYTKADVDAMLADPHDPLAPQHVVQLSDDEIMRLCQFDPRSIFHYTYGHWRDHQPDDPDAWYAAMRRRGHRYVAEYVAIKPAILAEVDAFVAHHMRGRHVLGVHVRGTDMRYAPPVPLERFHDEIDRRLTYGFDCVFVATDQQQYVKVLRARYGDRLIYQDCWRSTDARNPMWLAESPATHGREVLVDALLLSRCAFMLKSPSALSEFAHYFNPMLRSLDLNEHRTMVGGCDYTKPGLGYGDSPRAWDVVGGDTTHGGSTAAASGWIDPATIRPSGHPR